MMPDPPFVPAGVRPSPLCPGRRDVAAPASPEILLDEENVPQEPARDQDRRRSDQQPVVSLHRLLLPPVSVCSWRCLGADGQRRGASTHSSTQNPVLCDSISGQGHVRVATTGLPAAIASAALMPKLSEFEHITSADAISNHSAVAGPV